ncbi:hypothetical protein Tco_1090936, partial [Tanacetum coccineum]
GKFVLRVRTRGEVGVDSGTITVVKCIISDGSERKWAGIGTLKWLEWAGDRGKERLSQEDDIGVSSEFLNIKLLVKLLKRYGMKGLDDTMPYVVRIIDDDFKEIVLRRKANTKRLLQFVLTFLPTDVDPDK